MYINRQTEELVTWEELNTNVYKSKSIPVDGTINILEYSYVFGSTMPEYDENYQNLLDEAPVLIEQKYYKKYSLEYKELEICKAQKIKEIAMSTNFTPPKTIDGITYNGGEESATSIQKAIDFAKLKNDPIVKIWDINDKTRPFNILEAEHIVLEIGNEAYSIIYEFQNKKELIKSIKIGTEYPTVEDAVNKIRSI